MAPEVWQDDGSLGACLKAVHFIVQRVAEVRLEVADLQSFNAVQLQLLGDRAVEAVVRRNGAVMLEEVAARERRAYDLCVRQGREIMRGA